MMNNAQVVIYKYLLKSAWLDPLYHYGSLLGTNASCTRNPFKANCGLISVLTPIVSLINPLKIGTCNVMFHDTIQLVLYISCYTKLLFLI